MPQNEPQEESPSYAGLLDDWQESITHAVVETTDGEELLRIDDPEKLAMLLDYLVLVCQSAEPTPRPWSEIEGDRVIRFYNNEVEEACITLSFDGLLRVDEGVWLELRSAQAESLSALLDHERN